MVRVAVVGAMSAVGRELLLLLRRLQATQLRVTPITVSATASTSAPAPATAPAPAPATAPAPASALVDGELGEYARPGLVVEPVRALADLDFRDVEVALVAAGAEVSRQVAERAAGSGCLVVDTSPAFRLRAEVPLVVPTVNPEVLRRCPAANLVASPSSATVQLVRVLHPLHRVAGLCRVILTTYQAASGGGPGGREELAQGSATVLDGGEPPPRGPLGPPLAFNLVPQIGACDDRGVAWAEQALRLESRKIMGLPELRVSATAVRVPVFHCHSVAVWAEFDRPLSAAEAERTLAATRGLLVYRATDEPAFPTPRLVERSGQGRAWVHIGRVRSDVDEPRALWLWVTADNLWVGAALNAVDIVQTALDYGWLGG